MADIVLDQLDKAYENGYRAITNLNLTIDDGSFLVLVGPSGCGKSTALRMVAGLEDITGGELASAAGVSTRRLPRARHRHGVPELRAVPAPVRVREHRLRTAAAEDEQEGDRLRVSATPPMSSGSPSSSTASRGCCPGGQRQRVAMGRAIVREPSAFLMDEPLSNLDAKLRGQMRAEVAKLQKELGVTTLYVTHDQIEAMTMGDRVAVINGGILQQSAPPRDIYVDPDNLFVAGFMGSPPMNQAVADVEIEGDQVVVVVGGQRLTVDPELVNERPACAPTTASRSSSASAPRTCATSPRSPTTRPIGRCGPMSRWSRRSARSRWSTSSGHRADSDVEARGWAGARRTGADLDDVGGDVQPAPFVRSPRRSTSRSRPPACTSSTWTPGSPSLR